MVATAKGSGNPAVVRKGVWMERNECHLVMIVVDILNTSLLYRPSAAMTVSNSVSVFCSVGVGFRCDCGR